MKSEIVSGKSMHNNLTPNTERFEQALNIDLFNKMLGDVVDLKFVFVSQHLESQHEYQFSKKSICT